MKSFWVILYEDVWGINWEHILTGERKFYLRPKWKRVLWRSVPFARKWL